MFLSVVPFEMVFAYSKKSKVILIDIVEKLLLKLAKILFFGESMIKKFGYPQFSKASWAPDYNDLKTALYKIISRFQKHLCHERIKSKPSVKPIVYEQASVRLEKLWKLGFLRGFKKQKGVICISE